ncbi:hypothetical protein G9A89_019175 [Geosiphon pyriformis]|nr:hypothetical protein G9A89_019175 [Geosiphon pyriformis]
MTEQPQRQQPTPSFFKGFVNLVSEATASARHDFDKFKESLMTGVLGVNEITRKEQTQSAASQSPLNKSINSNHMIFPEYFSVDKPLEPQRHRKRIRKFRQTNKSSTSYKKEESENHENKRVSQELLRKIEFLDQKVATLEKKVLDMQNFHNASSSSGMTSFDLGLPNSNLKSYCNIKETSLFSPPPPPPPPPPPTENQSLMFLKKRLSKVNKNPKDSPKLIKEGSSPIADMTVSLQDLKNIRLRKTNLLSIVLKRKLSTQINSPHSRKIMMGSSLRQGLYQDDLDKHEPEVLVKEELQSDTEMVTNLKRCKTTGNDQNGTAMKMKLS